MDTANLPRDHPCYDVSKKKVPGYFYDENDGRTMSEFIALRSKSYAYILEGQEKIKAKGIRGHVVKNHMTLDDYKRLLFAEEYNTEDDKFNSYRENISIRSVNHYLETIKSNKLSFNRKDDKRCVLAHEHYRVTMMEAGTGTEPKRTGSWSFFKNRNRYWNLYFIFQRT